MHRIMWTRYSVMHDNYESFIEYVTKNVKEAYPKACDLQFTQPEYKKKTNKESKKFRDLRKQKRSQNWF